ncbi:MAG: ParB/RepB/Spo0J family partition protein [Muribaculaceae bacterium]|nr:ParB/RepB/Spo0J family partition protein [Muribaculaceae bacterium]
MKPTSTPKRRNALGRGLESLIGSAEVDPGGSSAISEIAVASIVPNPDQPRTDFDEESLEELAGSIREIGIVQPLTLRLADDGSYQIIAGERRWRAARKAGLNTVPAYVRTASDMEVTEMALIENIQREDLNAVEVALAFKKLIDVYHLTQERLSERVGKTRSTITNHLRLLKLPAEILLGLRDRKLDMGHARALLPVEDPKKQLKLYKRILKEDLSVRRVEQLAREAMEETDEPAERPARKTPAAQDRTLARKLSERFPAPVKIKRTDDGKGTLTFSFSNETQFKALLALLESVK